MIDDVRNLFFAGQRRIIFQLATGGGKTAVIARMAKTSSDQGMRTWFIVHRRELIKQSLKAFELEGIHAGVVANGWPQIANASTQICMVQSMKRAQYFKRPNILAIDEAHHCCANSYAKVYNAQPQAFKIGLTATPERLDGRGLKDFFDHIVKGPSISNLIDAGFLSNYKLFAPAGIDLKGVRSRMGDYVKGDLNVVVNKPTITGDAIKEYLKLAPGKRAVVFCVSVDHSKSVCQQFNEAGIKAEHIDGESSGIERDGAIERFERGETLILCNVELFGEGFDLPAIEVAVLLRPTQSLTLYLQQIGRALRPFPGKESAIILDHANNCERHGLPDEERDWSLEGHKKSKVSNSEIRIRVCPKCYAAMRNGVVTCVYCGYVFTASSKEIEHAAGDLAEVDVAALRRKRAWEVVKAQTYEELVELGNKRGYQRAEAWARIQMELRHKKILNRR